MKSVLFEIAAKRRSIYALGKDPPLDQGAVRSLVEEAVSLAPSAFNSQSSRILILHGHSHVKLWEKILELKGAFAPDAAALAKTKAKIEGFKAAAGTICFFEDQKTVRGYQEKFALNKDAFPVWSLESSGMLQYLVWTALAERGVGASLQHYNPLIDEWLTAHASLPPDWKLLAQMPYGSIKAPAEGKEMIPASERVRSIG
jgi:uncharacterized protein